MQQEEIKILRQEFARSGVDLCLYIKKREKMFLLLHDDHLIGHETKDDMVAFFHAKGLVLRVKNFKQFLKIVLKL